MSCIGTSTSVASSGEKNMQKLFNVLNEASTNGAIKRGKSFQLQSEETISSNYVFVRVRNGEFNYSTNPSNITSSGELRHNVMINSPQAGSSKIITTIVKRLYKRSSG